MGFSRYARSLSITHLLQSRSRHFLLRYIIPVSASTVPTFSSRIVSNSYQYNDTRFEKQSAKKADLPKLISGCESLERKDLLKAERYRRLSESPFRHSKEVSSSKDNTLTEEIERVRSSLFLLSSRHPVGRSSAEPTARSPVIIVAEKPFVG